MRFDLTDLRLFADVVAAGTITGGAAAAGLSLVRRAELRVLGNTAGLLRGRAQQHADAQAHRLGAAPRYRARVAGLAAVCRLAARAFAGGLGASRPAVA